MKKSLIILSFLISLATYCIAQTYTVNNNPATIADYTSLQTAIDSVPVGSTILVSGSSVSYGNIVIRRAVNIVGTGFNVIQNPQTQATNANALLGTVSIDYGADGAILQGFTTNSLTIDSVTNVIVKRNKVTNTGITVTKSTNVTINGCHVTGYHTTGSCYSWCYYASIDVATSSSLTISNNIAFCNIYTNGCTATINNNIMSIGVGLYGYDFNNTLLFNNIIVGSQGCGLGVTNANVHHNLFVSFKSGLASTITGNVDSVIIGSLFVGYPTATGYSDDGRYVLSQGSPAIGAGDGGTDCGIFGGTDPYVLSGIPAVPNIHFLSVPQTATTTGGLNVHIKVNANN